MAAKYGYIGNSPDNSSVIVARQSFSPTGVTTTFTFVSGYTIGYIDAYLNGSRLVEGQDYIATNGSTIDLVSAATNGDILELVAYKAFNVATIDTAPGNLNVGNNLTVDDAVTSTNLLVSGITTLGSSNGIGTVTVGVGGTALFVDGSARVTNILRTSNLYVTGVTTSDGGFVGNITGTASTASFATTSFGLSGSPNIDVTNLNVSGVSTHVGFSTFQNGISVSGNVTVGNITGSAATFTNLTVNGTQTIINTTELNIADKTVGIASTSTPSDALADGAGIVVYGTTNKTLFYDNTRKGWDFNIPLTTDEIRFYNVAEKLTRSDLNTVNLTYSSNGSNIGFATNPTGNITLNVTGIPTTSDFDNHVITFSVFVNQTGTARSCTAVNLNGVSATIRWAGGSLANAISGVTTTNGMDIYSFTGINTVGSASTTTNYYVLGVVNGGYR